MEIEIHNYLSCSHRLEVEPGTWDVIVVLGSSVSESSFVSERSRKNIQLWFDDIVTPKMGRTEPSAEVIGSALAFGLESQKLIVCCRAGQSRSSALAFSIAYEKLGEEAALGLLDSKRHAPNYRVLQIADALLERPGVLSAYNYWNTTRQFRLTDYLDEIEAEYDHLEALGARNMIDRGKLR